jgi:excisionase family DNA binding protein
MTKLNKAKTTDIDNKLSQKEDFYTVKQAAAKLDLTERTVTDSIRKNKITAHKKAGKWFILHTDLILFITSKD